MQTTILLSVLYFGFGVIYASFFEWYLHRFIMHRVWRIFGFEFHYAVKAHAGIHHTTFRADHTYVLGNHKKEQQIAHSETIPMAWWNGPLLIAIASVPFVLWSLIHPSWHCVISIAITVGLYYGTYEYLHWCMHKPMDRWFEKTWLFKRIDYHHFLHHENQGKNFNVVLPLADILLGTYVKE